MSTRGYLTPTELRLAVKAIRLFLANWGHPISVQCAELRVPTAPRFLKMLGFEPTGKRLNGLEIWKWQN